jgi:hypothetical protein
MLSRLADSDRIESRPTVRTLPIPPIAEPGDARAGDGRVSAARGILIALLISIPFWALVAFTLYILL